MLQLRPWLPESWVTGRYLTKKALKWTGSWAYCGIEVFGPLIGDQFEIGVLEHLFLSRGGSIWIKGELPILCQLSLAARSQTGSLTFPSVRERLLQAVAEDKMAKKWKDLPTIEEIVARMHEPQLLFSPDFSGDAPYKFYLFMLQDADMHFIYLEETNSGYDVLAFIDGKADLQVAKKASIGLLRRLFKEHWQIRVPDVLSCGLLDSREVRRIVSASPYFEQEDWEEVTSSWK